MKTWSSIIIVIFISVLSFTALSSVAIAGGPTVIRGDNQEQGGQDMQNALDAQQCKGECAHEMSICKTQHSSIGQEEGLQQCYRDYRQCVLLCKVPNPQ
jgi:hypothetical protein